MEKYPVELWRDDENGRLVIKAKNEGGNNATLVDLWDLVAWLQNGPREAIEHGHDIAGDRKGT